MKKKNSFNMAFLGEIEKVEKGWTQSTIKKSESTIIWPNMKK